MELRRRRFARVAQVAVATVAVAVGGLTLAALGSGPGSSVGAAPRGRGQEATTTRPEILVPGPTDPPSTTVVETTTVADDDDSGLTDRARSILADETGRTVALVIGGLLLVALILAVLTVRYWRKTRPVKVRAPAAAAGPHQVGSRRGR
jgi:hypothetical protein